MRSFAVAVILCTASGSAFGQERFVERTPQRRSPMPHTMEFAGNPNIVKARATPSFPVEDVGGYIGGARLRGNHIFARGAGAVTSAPKDGTYGTDYAGLKTRPNRVFLAPSYDPSIGPTIASSYRTDGPDVTDVFSLRPLRKAVIEAREAIHEKP